MKYYQELYLGERIKPDKIKWRIRFGRIPLLYYVITFACNASDQLEIMQASILKQKYYRQNPPYIIGVAKNYDEAVWLVQRIMNDTIRDTQGTDMRAYLMGKAEYTC